MDDLFTRQRRNLNALSIGLIVFFAAEGQFEKLYFSAVGISIDNPTVAVILVWVALGYFLYRFYISGAAAKHTYELDRLYCFYASVKNQTWAIDNAEGIINDLDQSGSRLIYVEKNFFRRYFNYDVRCMNSRTDQDETSGNYPPFLGRETLGRSAFRKQVPYWKMFWPEFVADIRAWGQPAASQIVLPYILVIAAVWLGILQLL